MSEDRELFSDRMLEGEYTTWNWLWTRNYGAPVNLVGLCVDNFGTVYALRDTLTTSYIITRANVSTTLANFYFPIRLFYPQGQAWSVNGKYVVGTKTNVPFQVVVYRYGANIWNVPFQVNLPDAQGPYVWAMSANGRYIAIVFRSTATLNYMYVVLLEGA